ncbi:hypothetical protein [Conyzicola sp.]|uniref:hypothetical protein n=1 Tax=Conyzicola sp. TaxID=1969404 RepID=UPI00398959B9
MAQSLQARATRANAVPAGVAAGIVGIVMLVQAILRTFVAVFSNVAYSSAGGINTGYDPGNVLAPFGQLFVELGTTVIPAAIGVFLAFWLLVPLVPELRVPRVVVRSLVAAAIAAALVLVFTAVYSGSSIFSGQQSFAYAVFGTAQAGLYTFINVTPLVILAGFLAWFWVSKGRPAASAL